MSETLSERLARGARIMRDTSQLKAQHPEWLLNEMADSADLLDEAAALARRVEGAEDGIADVLHKLDSWCDAYPEDAFPEPTAEQVAQVNAQYASAVTRISASMGRHMVKHMRQMADSIRTLTGARLVPEVDDGRG